MRFFNTYGPYETNEHLIPEKEIMKQLHKGRVLRLGNIETKRDYIYNEDIVRGVIKLSQSVGIHQLEIVNIGTGKEHSAGDIVETISRILGRKIDIKIDVGASD